MHFLFATPNANILVKGGIKILGTILMGHRFISQTKKTKEELFDALVKNAIDFLDSSLDDLEKRPKNSIVDFYTSIELFMKARLMTEHWSLILSKPENANIDSFRVGDFQSVVLGDAIKRLKLIVNEPLELDTVNNFKALGEHRNQIVHFAHSDYMDLDATKASIVVEQWSSWHHLHSLLTDKWSDVFNPYRDAINRVHERMMQQKDFIKARYDALKPKIEIEEKSGKAVIDCQHCEMHSAVITENHKWGTDYTCFVCAVSDTAVPATNESIECPDCHENFEFFDKSIANCPHCKSEITTDILIALCEEKYTEGDEWWEEGQPHIAGCHQCQNEQPSVFFIDNLWSCVCCYDRGWKAISCNHCGEFITGDMETIKYFACYKCEDEAREQFKTGGG